MLKAYIGCKIVNAQPAVQNGKPGFDIFYPDGYSSWCPEAVFEAAYREVTTHERQVLTLTDGEAGIARISDGDPDRKGCIASGSRHSWVYKAESGDWRCSRCPATSIDQPHGAG